VGEGSTLTADQRRRYARQVLLPEVGVAGQARVLAGAVRVLGDGRAAEEAATYLAAAGVGRIALAPKLVARIGLRLLALNPEAQVVSDDDASTLVVAPADPDRRAAGAEAALVALMALAGVELG